MKTSSSHETLNQISTTVQAVVESENSLAGILAQAGEDLFRIQSSALASGLDENLSALMPAPLPQNPLYLIWQVPRLVQVKAKRRVGNWQDSVSVLSRSQQQLLEWTSQSFLGSIGQACTAFSKINGVFFSRRQSAEVINFPDRRKGQEMAQTALDVRKQEPQRLARQAAA